MSAHPQRPTELHCYRPRQPASDCDATLTARLRDSLRVLQQQSDRIHDTIERKYNRHTRIELIRRAIEQETETEIRQALKGE